MAVYVDPLFTMMPRTAQARRYGNEWCHMIADTEEELHAMARKIGLKRSWFQYNTEHHGTPHYDLVPSKRSEAIRHGVIEIDLQEFTEKVKVIKEKYYG